MKPLVTELVTCVEGLTKESVFMDSYDTRFFIESVAQDFFPDFFCILTSGDTFGKTCRRRRH